MNRKKNAHSTSAALPPEATKPHIVPGWTPDFGGASIGFVDSIHGEDGSEVPDFAPTKHELTQLVKYWARRHTEIEFPCRAMGISGSSEMRESAYASARINRIEKLLGEEEVRRAVDEAEAEFARDVDASDWDAFCRGDYAWASWAGENDQAT